MIDYRTGNDLDVDAVIELYVASTLGQRRPVDDRDRMTHMIQNANLVITAWHGEQLVGIARSITDWVYCTYLSDLAVRQSHQRQGIGRELIERTRRAAPNSKMHLLSAPQAEPYYPHIGMTRHPSAWISRRVADDE